MDPLGVVAICFVGYLLLSKNNSAAAGTAPASAAPTNGLAAALANLQKSISNLGNNSATAQKQQSQAPGQVASAGNNSSPGLTSNKYPSTGSTFTDQATIDALATDGNASDAQVAAYLEALDQGNTDLANAIIGDVPPAQLENDPNPTALPDQIDAQPTDVPTYNIPEATYTPPADQSASVDTSVEQDWIPGDDPNSPGGPDYGNADYGDSGDGGGD
jgi:hypothetical protein